MTQAVQRTDTLESVSLRLQQLKNEIGRIFWGDPTAIELLLVALLSRGHVLLEGVPGVAKTTLVKAFATTLDSTMRRIQFTPDLLPADITGSYVLNPRDGSFALRKGPIFANLVLADEINRAPAKTQSALLEAMQERQVTIEGEGFALPEPFLVLATQNPVDLEGTYPLPEAQIDRFLVRVTLGYPGLRDEIAMLKSHGIATPTATSVLSSTSICELQQLTDSVFVEEDLFEYIARLCGYTRSQAKVVLGASPRASLSLLRATKARAILEGRTFITPDDVHKLAEPVLAHRLLVTPDIEEDPTARQRLIEEALAKVPYRKAIRPH